MEAFEKSTLEKKALRSSNIVLAGITAILLIGVGFIVLAVVSLQGNIFDNWAEMLFFCICITPTALVMIVLGVIFLCLHLTLRNNGGRAYLSILLVISATVSIACIVVLMLLIFLIVEMSNPAFGFFLLLLTGIGILSPFAVIYFGCKALLRSLTAIKGFENSQHNEL